MLLWNTTAEFCCIFIAVSLKKMFFLLPLKNCFWAGTVYFSNSVWPFRGTLIIHFSDTSWRLLKTSLQTRLLSDMSHLTSRDPSNYRLLALNLLLQTGHMWALCVPLRHRSYISCHVGHQMVTALRQHTPVLAAMTVRNTRLWLALEPRPINVCFCPAVWQNRHCPASIVLLFESLWLLFSTCIPSVPMLSPLGLASPLISSVLIGSDKPRGSSQKVAFVSWRCLL